MVLLRPSAHQEGNSFPATLQESYAPPSGLRLTPTQRLVLDALAAEPGASSTEVATSMGTPRNSVRGALKELRAKLEIGQADNIVQAARARGLLPPAGA